MTKIDKLTDEQQAQVWSYYDRYFRLATSTEPADRPRAEAAARRMAEIGEMKVTSVVWVRTPDEGKGAYDAAWDSLWASLWDSLRDSLWASLRDSLWASLRDSLWASLRASLSDSLWDSLWASLRDSLRDSLSASLSDSLRDSLRTSLRDSGWLAFYAYGRDVLQVQYDERTLELLHLHEEIAASCFALWIAPGTVILCERPAKCELADGKLVAVEFRARPDDGRVEPHCGWAPGNYDNKCCVCGEVFHDSDKRAVTCLKCADAELEKGRVDRVALEVFPTGRMPDEWSAEDVVREVLAAADGEVKP